MPVTDPIKIIAYLDPHCPWARGVVHFLESQKLSYEYRDITKNHSDYEEMVTKSGQHSSPCVEVDGHMLADVGGDEVEEWMRQRGMLD